MPSTFTNLPRSTIVTFATFLIFIFTLLKSECLIVKAQTDQCIEGETCENNAATNSPISTKVNFVNKSKYRADVYWDDGRFGKNIGTIEAYSGEATINTYVGHSFFVTRTGLREGLYDPETDGQHRFNVDGPDKVFVIPESAAPTVNPCQDRFSSCKREYEMGKCWESPGWMIVHCCKSCDKELDAARLIDPKVRCTRENLNMTGPVWKPGDLNKLFTSWAIDETFAKYEPKVLSSPDGKHGGKNGPWVIIFDDFLTDIEVDALIRGGDMMDFERSSDQGEVNELGEQVKVISQTHTSSNAWCRPPCSTLPEVVGITEKIESVTGVPKENYESFQILNYKKNQFYRRHHDSSMSNNKKPQGPRIMTFFLYLSDVEEGGETKFTEIDLAVKPKKGRALVWPSVVDDDPERWDPRMYHEAKDVIKGEKLAANHWIHLYDYDTPNRWGCTGSFS